jgi:hypothetical protein
MPSDVLFNSMVQFQGDVGWGRFLDAGTGLHSLKWIQGIPTSSWTAITADQNMRSNILSDEAVAAAIRPDDMLVVGNWMDEQFCSQLGMYDTILADYLIGAVDGFSPYEQDTIDEQFCTSFIAVELMTGTKGYPCCCPCIDESCSSRRRDESTDIFLNNIYIIST